MTTTESTQELMAENLMNGTDWLFEYAEKLGFGEVHVKTDEKTGLRAIIAVHSTARGPAIGGCRCISYGNTADALQDAMRLAQMMSYKAAICDMPHGGAKSVLIKPPQIKDTVAYYRSFGRFINELGGRYITAVDSGTSPAEMDMIAQVTPFVTCTSIQGDPSSYTALGVLKGIEAAVKVKLGKIQLNGVRVAIQGAGHVGYELARLLTERGAVVLQCDVNSQNLQRCVDDLAVTAVPHDKIYEIESDVFAPCALGAAINPNTVHKINAPIVAGSANNQLLSNADGEVLHRRGILYAPDFVINSGGLIYVVALYDHGNVERVTPVIENLYHVLTGIFERSIKENAPTSTIAEIMAKEKLAEAHEL